MDDILVNRRVVNLGASKEISDVIVPAVTPAASSIDESNVPSLRSPMKNEQALSTPAENILPISRPVQQRQRFPIPAPKPQTSQWELPSVDLSPERYVSPARRTSSPSGQQKYTIEEIKQILADEKRGKKLEKKKSKKEGGKDYTLLAVAAAAGLAALMMLGGKPPATSGFSPSPWQGQF